MRLSRASIPIAFIALFAAGAAGCGEDDGEQAGDAAVGVYRALGDNDAEAFCDQLSESVHERFTKLKIGSYVDLDKKPTCESNFELFRLFYGETKQMKDATPVDVSIKGSNATVALVLMPEDDEVDGTPKSEEVRLSLVDEDGEWKLASLNIPSPPPVTYMPEKDGKQGGSR